MLSRRRPFHVARLVQPCPAGVLHHAASKPQLKYVCLVVLCSPPVPVSSPTVTCGWSRYSISHPENRKIINTRTLTNIKLNTFNWGAICIPFASICCESSNSWKLTLKYSVRMFVQQFSDPETWWYQLRSSSSAGPSAMQWSTSLRFLMVRGRTWHRNWWPRNVMKASTAGWPNLSKRKSNENKTPGSAKWLAIFLEEFSMFSFANSSRDMSKIRSIKKSWETCDARLASLSVPR